RSAPRTPNRCRLSGARPFSSARAYGGIWAAKNGLGAARLLWPLRLCPQRQRTGLRFARGDADELPGEIMNSIDFSCLLSNSSPPKVQSVVSGVNTYYRPVCEMGFTAHNGQ